MCVGLLGSESSTPLEGGLPMGAAPAEIWIASSWGNEATSEFLAHPQ